MLCSILCCFEDDDVLSQTSSCVGEASDPRDDTTLSQILFCRLDKQQHRSRCCSLPTSAVQSALVCRLGDSSVAGMFPLPHPPGSSDRAAGEQPKAPPASQPPSASAFEEFVYSVTLHASNLGGASSSRDDALRLQGWTGGHLRSRHRESCSDVLRPFFLQPLVLFFRTGKTGSRPTSGSAGT